MSSMIKYKLLPTVMIALAAASTGCISWQSGDVRTLPEPLFGADKAPAAEKLIPLTLNVRYDAYNVDVEPAARTKAIDNIEGWARQVLQSEDQFSFGWASGPAYALSVDVVDDASPNVMLAVLSGVTLTVLPAVAVDDFTITARLKAPDGKPLGKHVVRQKMTTLIQLFMIFGMPVATPRTVEKELFEGVFRDVGLWTRDAVVKHKAGAAAPPPAQPAREEAL